MPFLTNAILILTKDELELIKETTFSAILNQTIEYGNHGQPAGEIKLYARSMVMNHLKKARELNGNMVYSSTTGSTRAVKADPVAPKGIVSSVLPEELQEYCKTLV